MNEETWLCDYVMTIQGFLSAAKCKQLIALSEDVGYEDALVNTAEGAVVRSDVRNNQRAMFTDESVLKRLWSAAEEYVPNEMEGRHVVGLNEMLRFYRYDPGQQFNWHQDFPYERDNGEKSFLTMMVYLNGDFEGGETSFDDSCSAEGFDPFSVRPEAGMALFFEHETHHKGEPVLRGTKYVVRTDVMYSANDDSSEQYYDEEEWN